MNPIRLQTITPGRLLVLGVLLLSGCSTAPPAPNWQLESKGAMDRSVAAYLEGNNRIEAAELARARAQLSRTGRADLVAGAELLHCAAHVASLVLEPCAGFEALRQDATDAQRAYADYLRGQLAPSKITLLPAAQQAAASRNASDATALQGIDDPLSRLVAAGVLLQTGKANPATLAQAVDTASSQGWRRPLLAWLGVQLQRATQAGQTAEAERLQRRIQLVHNKAGPPK
ncbi:MAG: hypothetical protein V4627_09275 [Pseudomonadota bacterium]